jgi:hypothetical protein
MSDSNKILLENLKNLSSYYVSGTRNTIEMYSYKKLQYSDAMTYCHEIACSSPESIFYIKNRTAKKDRAEQLTKFFEMLKKEIETPFEILFEALDENGQYIAVALDSYFDRNPLGRLVLLKLIRNSYFWEEEDDFDTFIAKFRENGTSDGGRLKSWPLESCIKVFRNIFQMLLTEKDRIAVFKEVSNRFLDVQGFRVLINLVNKKQNEKEDSSIRNAEEGIL